MKKYSRNTRNNKKQQRKLKMKGGIIKKNKNLSSWQAVYNMITSEHSSLTSISYDSLVGFVFKLDISDKKYSEFLGLNDRRTRFNEPVKSLIFKIVIIHHDTEKQNSKKRKNTNLNDIDDDINETEADDDDDDVRVILEPYQYIPNKYHRKGLEKKKNFVQEAKVQQDIYLKTINPNGNYICPSVIDLSLFKNDDAKNLINDLLKTKNEDHQCKQMLNYLKKILKNPLLELGMITMELVDKNYTPIYNIYKNDIYTTNCEYALAELIILFIKLKLVNYDCHSGNVLAKINGNSKSLLIDFGRVIDLNKPVPQNIKQRYESFTGTKFDQDFHAIKNINVTDFFGILEKTNDMESEIRKIKNIKNIIRFIAFIDFSINYTKYNTSQPQMNSLIRFLYGDKLHEENTKTFNWYDDVNPNTKLSIISICNKIEELTIVPVKQNNIFSADSIKSKTSKNILFDNEIDAKSSYREDNPYISKDDCDPNNDTCWTRTMRRVGTMFGFTRNRRPSPSSSQTRKKSPSTSPQRNSSSKTGKRKKD
jgi:hypothetical protein